MLKRFDEFLNEATDFQYFTGKNTVKGFRTTDPEEQTRAYDSGAYKDQAVDFATSKVQTINTERDEAPTLDINLADDILALKSFDEFHESKLIKKEISYLIKEELLNWSPEKGDPYDYEIGKKEKRNPLPDVLIEVVDYKPKYGKTIIKHGLNHHMKTIEKLPEEYYTLLLAGSKKEGLVTYLDGLKEDIDNFEVYFTYPFSKIVKATIPAQYKAFDWIEDDKVTTENSIGYYIKQISNAYGATYKKLAEKIGVWGHGFSDLYLERIEFTDDNKIKISIGS